MLVPDQIIINVRENIQTEVLVAGEGKPIVFLHGAGGLTWDPYLEELSKHYKVFAPRHPGTGRSTGANALHGWWDLVLYYYDLFDRLGLETVDVIGHSFGGMAAAELAATDKRRINNLLLICAAGLWRDDQPITDVFSLTMLPDQLFPKLFADLNSPAAQAAMRLPEDPNERLQMLLDRTTALSETGRYLWPIPDKGLSRRIHRIKAKTLIIWGEKDGIIPVIYAHEFRKKITESKVHIIEDAAHWPQLEQLPEVLNLTLEFMGGTN